MFLDAGSKLLEPTSKSYGKVQRKEQSATLDVTGRLSSWQLPQNQIIMYSAKVNLLGIKTHILSREQMFPIWYKSTKRPRLPIMMTTVIAPLMKLKKIK